MKKKLGAIFLIVLVLLGTLAACGFSPIYGQSSASNQPGVAAQLNQVAIDGIANRQGQQLRNLLIDRMYGKGRPQQATHRLSVVLNTSESDLGIRKDATAARAELNVSASVTLTESRSGKEVLQFNTNSIVSYNKVDAQYAALTAQKNAEERAVGDLAEKIINRVSLFFAK
jgi:LPS-assembly lipoprotein